ncbi:hypothetical protein CHU98_g827 [Xylaria longipes]|nr:hypothetical protein CHU98_g827 [Xylaria longipes]
MLFSSPYADKIKAPHPPGRIPQRGYSGSGKETAYYEAGIKSHGDEVAIGQSHRKISDLEGKMAERAVSKIATSSRMGLASNAEYLSPT